MPELTYSSGETVKTGDLVIWNRAVWGFVKDPQPASVLRPGGRRVRIRVHSRYTSRDETWVDVASLQYLHRAGCGFSEGQ
jgi:hypothetical protein